MFGREKQKVWDPGPIGEEIEALKAENKELRRLLNEANDRSKAVQHIVEDFVRRCRTHPCPYWDDKVVHKGAQND